jgi:hypothetical protein
LGMYASEGKYNGEIHDRKSLPYLCRHVKLNS